MVANESFLGEVLNAIAVRGRLLLGGKPSPNASSVDEFARICSLLLDGRGEASGLALAAEAMAMWRAADAATRLSFLRMLGERFGPDEGRLAAAVHDFADRHDQAAAIELHAAAEPRRQELFRRLNMVQGATAVLLDMRTETMRGESAFPELAAVDSDLTHLLSSWFNRGFLSLRRIDWSTPANVLEKIIQYEAVHAIRDWSDLKQRLAPRDRRCFAFFHPQLPDEPLIFVEVALMRHMPASIDEVLANDAGMVSPDEATTAVFYSISNCQPGLRGISFGNFLLKQVIEELAEDLPGVRDFVTLSPVPGFAAWLASTGRETSEAARELSEIVASPGWSEDAGLRAAAAGRMPAAAALHFTEARDGRGLPQDPVARFHLGNGARLERINVLGDTSPKGMKEAHGLMVNYRYQGEDLVKNHERFAAAGEVAMHPAIRKFVRGRPRIPVRQQQVAAARAGERA